MTVIFTDGFENNNILAWTGSVIQGANTLATSSTQKNTGVYSLYINQPSSGSDIYVYKDLNGASLYYAREYVYFTTLPTGIDSVITLLDGATSRGLHTTYVSGAGWALKLIQSATVDYQSAVTASTGQWYCIELELLLSTTVGVAKLWVDGSLTVNQTGLNTSEIATINMLRSGISSFSGTSEVYVDDVVVADAYIGLSSVSYTRTLTDLLGV